jgi:hypothetical protein
MLPDVPPPGQDGFRQGFETPEPTWMKRVGVARCPVDRGGSRRGSRARTATRSGRLTSTPMPIPVTWAAATCQWRPLVRKRLPSATTTTCNGRFTTRGWRHYQVPDFAEARAFEMNAEPENWRGAEAAEYDAYEYLRDLEAFDRALADEPPEEAIDPLIQTAIELGGVVVEQEIEPEPEVDEAAFQALNAIGVEAENFDPTTDPPPFYDAETGTAYWIGVFQPDKDDRENCVTSILSLGRDPETGEMEAQLAPCVPGDWDKAYGAAEHLIRVAQKGDLEQVFDTAEGMALATDQRELWEAERGVPLEADAARDIADYTRDQWEVEL